MSDYSNAIKTLEEQEKRIIQLENMISKLNNDNKVLKKTIANRENKLQHILDYAHEKLSITEEHQIKRIYGLKKGKSIDG